MRRKRTPGENRLLALGYLKRHGPMTASNLGDMLWCGRGKLDDPPMRKPQAFARPAANLLKKLEADNLVRWRYEPGGRRVWSVR